MATANGSIGDLAFEASSPGACQDYSVRLTLRANDPTNHFSLDIIKPSANNAVLESVSNLSLSSADPRFAPAVINGRSAFIDNLSLKNDPPAVPVNNPGVPPGRQHRREHCRCDGAVIGPADADADFRTGLLALFAPGGIADRIDLFNIICVPGLVDAAPSRRCRRTRSSAAPS